MNWDERVAALWAKFDAFPPEEFLAQIQALAAERPADDPAALFERACGHDSIGEGEKAEPLYRAALAGGLSGIRRRRAIIQMASTLRNLGHADESVRLLTEERAAGSDELDDAVVAFLALALASSGKERQGLSLALSALARHLPRYNRSLANYAADLAE